MPSSVSGWTSSSDALSIVCALVPSGRFIGNATAVANNERSVSWLNTIMSAAAIHKGSHRLADRSVDRCRDAQLLAKFDHGAAQPGHFESVSARQVDLHRRCHARRKRVAKGKSILRKVGLQRHT